jgi:hypothetical protein
MSVNQCHNLRTAFGEGVTVLWRDHLLGQFAAKGVVTMGCHSMTHHL